jgi:hypothetical protein
VRGAGDFVTIVLRLTAALGALIALVAALHHVAGVPESDMSASRIVPAVALARGFPIYAGPDAGPIIDFMYGPVAALAFLPAALAATPSGALAVAALLNALWFFGPMAWLHRRAGAGLAWVGFVLFVLWTLRDPGLVFSALTIHADAPALGLGALACGLLLGPPRLAASALAMVLAAAAKQTMAPLALALLGLVLARDGARAAARFAAWAAGFGVAAAAIALAVFGLEPLLFNMVTLPARMPWYGEATAGGWGAVGFPPGRWPTVGFTATLLGRLAWLPALVAVGTLVLAPRREPGALLAAAAVVLTPIAVVSAAKVGGFFNTFSVVTYFLAAAATIGLVRVASADGRAAAVARLVLFVGLVACAVDVARGPAGVAGVRPTLARLAAWDANPQSRAHRAARAHPGELGLPWNPLATLLAENRLDNNEIGAWNRDLAGIAIPDALWRRHLPPRLRLLAFRPATGAFAWLPAPTGRLPEFATPVTLPGLEGWTVLAPALAAPPPSRQENDPHGAPAPPHP